MPETSRRLLLDPAAVQSAIEELAQRIADRPGPSPLRLVGIHKRGVPLAQRLAAALDSRLGEPVEVGTIDITQYRDDLGTLQDLPTLVGSDIPFTIDDARVVLCDEVVFTGRSIRAALGELLDFGRPAVTELAALIDREGREFPIQPNYAATRVEIEDHERVAVRFTEVDGEDAVYIESTPSSVS